MLCARSQLSQIVGLEERVGSELRSFIALVFFERKELAIVAQY